MNFFYVTFLTLLFFFWTSDKPEDLASWVTVENNDWNDWNAGKKTKAGSESDVSQFEKEGKAKAKSEKRKEAGQKEDEKTALTENQFQDAIELLNDFYDNDWTKANISLLEGNRFEKEKIIGTLFHIIWVRLNLFTTKACDTWLVSLRPHTCI